MPFGSDSNASAKIATIRTLAGKIGLEVHVPAYDIVAPAFDIVSALEEIRLALFMLADLTGERPSCYYELGLAEALGKPVQIIAESGTKIHQTAARSTVLYYDRNTGYGDTVMAALAQGLYSTIQANVGRSGTEEA